MPSNGRSSKGGSGSAQGGNRGLLSVGPPEELEVPILIATCNHLVLSLELRTATLALANKRLLDFSHRTNNA